LLSYSGIGFIRLTRAQQLFIKGLITTFSITHKSMKYFNGFLLPQTSPCLTQTFPIPFHSPLKLDIFHDQHWQEIAAIASASAYSIGNGAEHAWDDRQASVGHEETSSVTEE
jgi:hypothetical protein